MNNDFTKSDLYDLIKYQLFDLESPGCFNQQLVAQCKKMKLTAAQRAGLEDQTRILLNNVFELLRVGK